MNHNGAQEFLNNKTKDELVTAYRDEYLEWKRTGILSDGVIRDTYNILSEDSVGHVSLQFVDKMFNERLAELYYLDAIKNEKNV